MDTIAHDEAVEAELTRLVEKRSPNGHQDPDELEPTYAESVRRYHERATAERRAQWIDFHRHMAQLHAWLSEEHAQKAKL